MCGTDISSIRICTRNRKMATPQKTVKGLALLRSYLLLVTLFALTGLCDSYFEIKSSCRDPTFNCGSSSIEVQEESVPHWTTQPIESTSSSPDPDDSEISSTPSDSIAFQPEDASVIEPALSEDDSSDAGYSTYSTTSGTEESVTLMPEDSTTTPSSKSRFQPEEIGTISLRTTRFRYEPLTCCHLARNFPFAHKLRDDPCNVMTKESMGKKDAPIFITEEKQVYDHLVKSVGKLQNLVEDTLREDVPLICKNIRWYPVAKIPTQRDIQDLGTKNSLYLYHSSLLNHTAYLHHMFYQVHKYDRSCNRGEIVLSARRIIFDIKKVTCNLRRYLLAVYDKDINEESFEKPLEESLDVSLCEECVCARRALYDCHVVLSLNSVLNQFANFMRKLHPDVDLFGSASNLPTDESSDSHSSSDRTTSGSRESATLSTEEFTTSPLSESLDLVTQPDVTTIESTETTEKSERGRIPCPPAKNFEFVDKLRDNPCKILPSDDVHKKSMTGMEPFSVNEVYDILRQYVALLKRTTDNTKRNDLLNDCEEYKFGSVAEILTQSKLHAHGPGEILYMHYSSLTNLTAHVYNMHHLLQKYDTTCSRGIIQASARTLAFGIRKVTCFLRLYILAAYPAYSDDSFIAPIMQAMEESLCDEYYCTRRAIYDCLVVTTLDDVLGELATFMERIDPIETTQKLKPSIQIRFKMMLNYPEL